MHNQKDKLLIMIDKAVINTQHFAKQSNAKSLADDISSILQNLRHAYEKHNIVQLEFLSTQIGQIAIHEVENIDFQFSKDLCHIASDVKKQLAI